MKRTTKKTIEYLLFLYKLKTRIIPTRTLLNKNTIINPITQSVFLSIPGKEKDNIKTECILSCFADYSISVVEILSDPDIGFPLNYKFILIIFLTCVV